MTITIVPDQPPHAMTVHRSRQRAYIEASVACLFATLLALVWIWGRHAGIRETSEYRARARTCHEQGGTLVVRVDDIDAWQTRERQPLDCVQLAPRSSAPRPR